MLMTLMTLMMMMLMTLMIVATVAGAMKELKRVRTNDGEGSETMRWSSCRELLIQSFVD